MKFIISILSLFLVLNTVFGQSPQQFNVSIEPIMIEDIPGLHSYVWGLDSQGRWLIIGGRTDGLHRRQPWASFWEEGNNDAIFVVDPETKTVWTGALDGLETKIKEQLQSTNMQFYQHDNQLIITGGYAFSPTANDHITFPYLTSVDVDGLTNAIVNSASITTYISIVENEQMAVTGGQMGIMDGYYYLVGGQRFDGRYNPMGPNHGPGFTQTYSSEIKKFKVEITDGVPVIVDYSTTIDDDNLHRRDYNMLPQIFPNGEEGFTVYSGVFQKDIDLPFLDCVDIRSSGYEVIPNFNQYLNQYHNAKIPVYDASSNTSHSIFFGGMSQFSMNDENNLVEDENVPFIKTISMVTRNSDNKLKETKLDVEMPVLIGSGAEFIPVHNDTYFNTQDILMLNNLPQEKILVGYIYGGIESSEENIFFTNDGTQSIASNVIFKVYIDQSTVGTNEIALETENVYNFKVFPNPTIDKKVTITLLNPKESIINITVTSLEGNLVATCYDEKTKQGNLQLNVDLSIVPKGTYLITMKIEQSQISRKIIIQ